VRKLVDKITKFSSPKSKKNEKQKAGKLNLTVPMVTGKSVKEILLIEREKNNA